MNTSLALRITVFHTKKGEEKGSMTFIKYLEAHLLLNEVAFIEIKVNSSNAYHAKVTVHFVLYHITFITKSRNKNLLTLLYNRLSISDEEILVTPNEFNAYKFFFPTSNYTIQELVLLKLSDQLKVFHFHEKIEMLIETVTARRINFITFL